MGERTKGRVEYALEIYNDNGFESQVDLTPSIREAKHWTKEYANELGEGDYFVIKQITYDVPDEYGDEKELDVEVVYSTKEN